MCSVRCTILVIDVHIASTVRCYPMLSIAATRWWTEDKMAFGQEQRRLIYSLGLAVVACAPEFDKVSQTCSGNISLLQYRPHMAFWAEDRVF